jgi:HPt (histidine-containing phosphotransfer) domain-containing protein
MPDIRQALKDLVETSNSGRYADEATLMSKFPELKGYDIGILKDFVATANSGNYQNEDELFDKFPEFNLGGPVPQVKKNSQLPLVSGSKGFAPTEELAVGNLGITGLQKVKKPEEKAIPLQNYTPSFVLKSVEGINANEISKQEETLVPEMNYKYGPLGFKFEESGYTGNYMKVVAPNGKDAIEISLGLGAMDKYGEAEKLKQFIKENSRTLSTDKLSAVEEEYKTSKKVYNSQKEIDETVKTLNKEAEDLMAAQKIWAKQQDEHNIEVDKFNKIPVAQRSTPQYKEQYDALIKQRNELDIKRVELTSGLEGITNKEETLNKSVGRYTEMKGQQGTWYEYVGEKFLRGIGKFASFSQGLVSDITAATLPDAALMPKSEWEKGYVRLAKEKGIEVPKSKDEYSTWFSKLPDTLKEEFHDKLIDEVKKTSKYSEVEDTGKSIQQTIRDKWTLPVGSMAPEYRERLEKGFISGAIGGAIESIPAFIGGGRGVPGAAFRLARLVAQAEDATFEEMEKDPDFKNVSENEKRLISMPISIATAVLEEYGFRNIISNKGLLNRLTLAALKKSGATTTAKTFGELVRNEIDGMVAKGALTLVGASLAEAETGALQQVAEIAVKEIYNEVKDKRMFDTPESVGEFVADVVKAGAQEAIGGFVLGTPSAVGASYAKKGFLNMSDEQFRQFESMANDNKLQTAFVTSLKNKINQGLITRSEAKEQLNDYRNSVSLYNQLPENLSLQGKKEAMNLIKEKNALKQQIEGKDDALVVNQKERIAAIDAELGEISKTKTVTNFNEEETAQLAWVINDEINRQKDERGGELKKLLGVDIRSAALTRLKKDFDSWQKWEGKTEEYSNEEIENANKIFNLKISLLERSLEGAKPITLNQITENAIQEPSTATGVPSTEQPQLGLQEMGEGNAQPQGTPPGTQEVITPEQGQEEVATVIAPEPEVTTTEEVVSPKTPPIFSLDGIKRFFHASSTPRSGRLKPSNAKNFGTGIYFSTNKDTVQGEFGDNVTEVSLNIENPVNTNTKEWNEVQSLAIKLADEDYGKRRGLTLEEGETVYRYDPDNLSEIDEIPSEFISKAAKQLGYDAIIDKGSMTYDNEVLVLDESKVQYDEDTTTPTVEEKAKDQYKPVMLDDTKMDAFTKENATDYQEAERQDSKGNTETYASSMTLPLMDANGVSIGTITMLEDSEGNLSWNANNLKGKKLGTTNFETKGAAKKALVADYNKNKKKSFDRAASRASTKATTTTTTTEPTTTTTEAVVETPTVTVEEEVKQLEELFPDETEEGQVTEEPQQEGEPIFEGVSMTGTEVDALKSRVGDKAKVKIIEAAQRAIDTLKSLFPNIQVVVHETQASYDAYMSSIQARQNTSGNFSYSENDKGATVARIDINLSKANARTVSHEMTHAVLLKTFGEDVELFKKFRKRVSAILSEGANTTLTNFANRYIDSNGNLLEESYEEFLSEFNAMLVQEEAKISTTMLQKIADLINKVVSKATSGKFKPFQDVADTKQVVDFFNDVANSIREGREISNTNINENGVSGRIEATSVRSKSSISSGELKRFPINENTKVEEDVPLSRFNGKLANVHESDRMTGAYISDTEGNPIFKFFGGVYFPIITGKWWASRGKTTAESITKYANINRDEDGYIYSLPMVGSENQHMSNVDMLNATIELMKYDVKNKKTNVKLADVVEYITKAFVKKDLVDKEVVLKSVLKKSKSIDSLFDELSFVLFQDGEFIVDRDGNIFKDAKGNKVTNFSFEQRDRFVESVLGDPKVKEVRFPSSGSLSQVAKRFEEPITSKVNRIGDVVTVMRTKGKLVAKPTPKEDPFYHKSYPYEISAVDENGNPAEVEVYILDGAYSLQDILPVLNKPASGGTFNWAEYYEKHSPVSQAKVEAQYARTAKISYAAGNIKSKAQLPETIDTVNGLVKANKIEGKLLSEQEAENLQQEIESNYLKPEESPVGPANKDIRANLFNFDNPMMETTVNGVNIRVANGMIEPDPKTNRNRKSLLVYADGKIVGKFYSTEDVKKVIKFIKDNLIDNAPQIKSKSQLSTTEKIRNIINEARGRGFSEVSIATFLKNKGYSATDIASAMTMASPTPTLNEQTNPGYDSLMQRVDKLIARQRARGVVESKVISNIDTYIRNSDLYKTLNDQQKKFLELEGRNRMNTRERRAPSIGRVLGVLADITNISRSEKLLVIKRIRELSQDAAKNLAMELRNMASKGSITTAQAANVLARFGKVNLLNEVSVSNFVDYMAKVFANAEYAAKMDFVRKKLSAAKKNVLNKIGIGDGLAAPLIRLFSINPTIIPDSVLDRYIELVKIFSEKAEVLTLPEKSLVIDEVNDILQVLDEEQSLVETLLDVVEQYQNKVLDANGNLDLDQTIKNMIDDGVITEDDAAIMRKYRTTFVPRASTKKTQQELDDEKNEMLDDLSNITVNGSGLSTRDERKLANDIAELIQTPAVRKLSNIELKNLLKVIDNINNNYIPHFAQVIKEKMNSINKTKPVVSSIYRSVLLPLSKVVANVKNKLSRKKNATLTMIERNPLYYIDQVFGDFKTQDLYNALLLDASIGDAAYKSELKVVQELLEQAEQKVAESHGLKPDPTLMSKYKMMTYMIQLEFLSNPGNEQVNEAAKYINETIKFIESSDASRYTERDVKMLEDILSKFAPNGEVDINKLYDSFNDAEKDAIKTIRELNESLKDKAEYTAAIIRGDRISPLSNYVHLNVLQDPTQRDAASSSPSDIANMSNMMNPSTKAKSLIKRTRGAKALNFDIFASAQRGAKFVLMDYNLTEPIRTARMTLNNVKKELEVNGRIPKEQRDKINALESAFRRAVENLLLNSFTNSTTTEEVIDYISKQGYRAVLAGTTRFTSELMSNIGFALITDPKAMSEGVKYFKLMTGEDALKVLQNINSTQITRIIPTSSLSGSMVDTSILRQAGGVRGARAMNPVANKINQLWNKSGKKYLNAVEFVADTLISTPDKLIMRPMWFGSFANAFKSETGQSPDFEKIAQNDEAYMNQYKEAIKNARTVADGRVVLTGATDNAFMGVLKGTRRVDDSAAMKAFNNFNNYMTKFLIFEYITARTGIAAAMGNGMITRKQGVALIAGVTTRMTVYTLLSQVMGTGLMGLLFGGDEEEEDEKSIFQKFGQQLTSSLTSLLFGRDFGQGVRGVLNIGLEKFNKEFLDGLREGKYDPYKDAIQYPIIPPERKGRQTDLGDILLNMSGSFSPAMKTADFMVRKALEAPKKEEDAIERRNNEIGIRIPLEVAGNAGLIPLYKDIKKVVMNELYKDLRLADERAADKKRAAEEKLQGYKNSEDMKRYAPKLWEETFGPKSKDYDVNEAKKKLKREKAKIERERKDELYNYTPKKRGSKSSFGGGEQRKSSFGGRGFGSENNNKSSFGRD